MNITFLSSLMRKVSHQKAFKKADFWTESSRALYSKEKKEAFLTEAG